MCMEHTFFTAKIPIGSSPTTSELNSDGFGYIMANVHGVTCCVN